MTSKKGQPAGPDSQEEYEATVLNFLDKEMANVQPVQKKDQQSEELDALVSDLLKQVLTEADQKQSTDKPLLDAEDELFAGLTRADEKALHAASTLRLVPSPAATVQAEPEPSTLKPKLVSENQPAEATSAAVFASVVGGKTDIPS